MQNFVAIRSGVSAPKYVILPCLWGDYSFSSFWGFFNKATAYIPERIFTPEKMSFWVKSAFRGSDDYT